MIRKYLFLLMVVMLSACVHEFPDETTPADVVLNIHMDISMDEQTFVNIAKEDEPSYVNELTRSTERVIPADEYDCRSVIRFYRQDGNDEYDYSRHDYEFVVIEDDPMLSTVSTEVKVAEGTYMIYVWRDYVRQGEKESPYYNVEDFRAITCVEEYTGSQDSKDAMFGSTKVQITRYGKKYNENHFNIAMERPFARIVIISNDLDEFVTKAQAKKYKEMLQNGEITDSKASELKIDLSDYDVRFVYMSDGLSDKFGTDKPTIYDLPTTFNMFKGQATASRSNVSFSSSIVKLSDYEAQLGFDYILPSQGMAYVAVGVYDKNGTQLAMTPSIAVPVKKNQETVVTGSFLIENISGGAVINPDFSGDHNYEIK